MSRSSSSTTPKVESEKLQLPKFEDFLGSEGLDILNRAITFLNGDGGKYDDYFVFDTVVIENDILNHNLKEYQTRESINNAFDKINEELRTDIINGALEARVDMDFMEPVQEVCMEKIAEKSLENGSIYKKDYELDDASRKLFMAIGTAVGGLVLYFISSYFNIPNLQFGV